MNRELAILILIFNVFLATFSQLLLKHSANQQYKSRLKEVLNFYVVGSYSIFFCITVINVLAYRYVEFSEIVIIESLSYISILILSRVFFKEHLKRTQSLGVFLIITGVVLFSI